MVASLDEPQLLFNLHGFGVQLVDEIRKMDNVPANAEAVVKFEHV
jgi:hypothetical protein